MSTTHLAPADVIKKDIIKGPMDLHPPDRHRENRTRITETEDRLSNNIDQINNNDHIRNNHIPNNATNGDSMDDLTGSGENGSNGASQSHYSLRWNNHQAHILGAFDALLKAGRLVDVSLVCFEGRTVRAHKVVLSACSPFFQRIFWENPCKHPVIVLNDFRGWEVQAIIDFMYRGEVSVGQEQLPSLIKAAESLQVRGLAANHDDDDTALTATVETRVSTPDDCVGSQPPTPQSLRECDTPPLAKLPHMSNPFENLTTSSSTPLTDKRCTSPMPRRKQARPRRRSGELTHPQDLSNKGNAQQQAAPQPLIQQQPLLPVQPQIAHQSDITRASSRTSTSPITSHDEDTAENLCVKRERSPSSRTSPVNAPVPNSTTHNLPNLPHNPQLIPPHAHLQPPASHLHHLVRPKRESPDRRSDGSPGQIDLRISSPHIGKEPPLFPPQFHGMMPGGGALSGGPGHGGLSGNHGNHGGNHGLGHGHLSHFNHHPGAGMGKTEPHSPLPFPPMPSVSALAMTPPHSNFFGLDSPLGLFPPGLDGCRNPLLDLTDPRGPPDPSQIFSKKKMGRPKGQHSAPRGGPPRSWTNAELTEALQHVWNKKMTTSQASRIFGIPYNSLLMYVRGKYGKSLKLEQLRKDCTGSGGPTSGPLELLSFANNNVQLKPDRESGTTNQSHSHQPPPQCATPSSGDGGRSEPRTASRPPSTEPPNPHDMLPFNPFAHSFYPDFASAGFPIPVNMLHLLPQADKAFLHQLPLGMVDDDCKSDRSRDHSADEDCSDYRNQGQTQQTVQNGAQD